MSIKPGVYSDKNGAPVVWRTVLTADRYRTPNGQGCRYEFMLGVYLHRIRCKASDGIPKRKRCKQCEHLADGGIYRVVTGAEMLIESWDPEHGKPRKETQIEYSQRASNEAFKDAHVREEQ